jgi:hypothetical protein
MFRIKWDVELFSISHQTFLPKIITVVTILHLLLIIQTEWAEFNFISVIFWLSDCKMAPVQKKQARLA